MGFRLAGMTDQHGTRRAFGIRQNSGWESFPARHPFRRNLQIACSGRRLSEERAHWAAATSFAWWNSSTAFRKRFGSDKIRVA
jgi:hypothetical protein